MLSRVLCPFWAVTIENRGGVLIIGLQITDVAIGTAFMLTGIYRYKMVLNFGSDIPTVLRSECTKEVFVQLMTISYQMQ
ncbi:unnamed protein product, partial [Haemonchus placei]|uniref:7TM_GPCR_Srx domain-containing protein n=1 Tax=Haemonchus placei TaxID=6290 RepID=A0A0N4VZ60_HAEPC